MIDLNDMRLFAQVVEAGSFTAAAGELSMPKSTLSRRVARLEEQLDSRLLQRTTRSLHLTDIGSEFYRYCKRMVAEAQAAELAVNLNNEEPRGVLRITAPIEFGNNLLGNLSAGYLKQYPRVSLEVDLSNQFVDLIEEGFDLALRAGQLEDSSYVARRLGQARLVVCASPGYLEPHKAPESPQQLNEHDCLVYPGKQGRQILRFSRTDSSVTVSLEGRLVVNSMGTLCDAAVAGLGIAVLPIGLCRQAITDGKLVPLLEEWQLPEDGVYAVYPSARYLTAKVRSFIDFVDENWP